MDKAKLQKMTVVELKEEMRRKDMPVSSGMRKSDLIDALLAREETFAGRELPTVQQTNAAVNAEREDALSKETKVESQPQQRTGMSTQKRMGARTQPVQTFRQGNTAPVGKPMGKYNAENRGTRGNESVRRTNRTAENAAPIKRDERQGGITNGNDSGTGSVRTYRGSAFRKEQEIGNAVEGASGVQEAPAEPAKPAVVRNRDTYNGELGEGAGILEIHPEGYGFLRADNYLPGNRDVYVAAAQIRRFNLRTGDYVKGKTRTQQSENQSDGLIYITEVNGEDPEKARYRKPFDSLIPVYPDQRLRMERPDENDPSLRLIDIIAPIGKGQRGMIVSQPKAGKTTLLKKIANAITKNAPEVHLMVLLIDERPEEVTDMKRSITGEVIYSTFDEAPENHTRVSEMVLERAQRLVEQGKDVVILLDSITRLARAYNLVIPPTGRSLSGGLDPGALYRPKRFFGAARNIENGGSLTIIATALVDTGSRMDDIIFEEFKGTGNMELHLDRSLSERRIFPAIDLFKSGTRREDLLLTSEEAEGAYQTRRMLSKGNPQETCEQLISFVLKTKDNNEYLQKIKGWMRAYEKDGYRLK